MAPTYMCREPGIELSDGHRGSALRVSIPISVMAGLVPAIHVFSLVLSRKTWVPGTRLGMTMDAE
jgi:hypothetical protein